MSVNRPRILKTIMILSIQV